MGLNKTVLFWCVLLALVQLSAGVSKADNFPNGQFVTHPQGDWGAGGDAAPLLSADYDSVFASTGDELVVGVTGTPGQYALAFSSASNTSAYLPTIGAPAPLTTNLANPVISPSGTFGGDVVALLLNLDFNAAGDLQGTASIPFGDLVLTNFSGGISGLNGLTVNQFLGIANTCLGDGSCPYGVGNIAEITDEIDASFANGNPSAFADANLALPNSSTPAPEPSSLFLLAAALASLGFLRQRIDREKVC
jgi:hypothetical protein